MLLTTTCCCISGDGQVLLLEGGAELLEELAVGIGGHVLHAENEER